MATYGIIAEYNPFHNGHLYQINKIKQNGNKVVCVMSPNVVQRGDFALFSKWTRTQAALMCGADLVLELPTPYALSSAEKFAQGGIEILSKLGTVDFLCFGSECADISMLEKIADAILDKQIDQKIMENLKQGITYAKARSLAVSQSVPEADEILSRPNDILAVEYIKQLKIQNSKIKPYPIKRIAVEHNSRTTQNEYSSASFLRENFNIENIEKYTPAADIYKEKLQAGEYSLFVNSLSDSVLLKIIQSTPEKLRELPDVSEGLENRIIKAAHTARDITELCEMIKTKRYTMSRIKRILMYILLDLPKKEDIPKISYIRILGANENGKKLISNASLPVITSLSKARDTLTEDARALAIIEEKTTAAFSLSLKNRTAQNEYSQKPIGF